MVLNLTRQQLGVPLHRWLRLCGRAFAQMLAHKCFTHAAAIAYYVIVSIFPLLLLLTGILGFILKGENTQSEVLYLAGRYLPSGSLRFVRENIDAIVLARGSLSFISAAGLLWSATLMFDEINEAINAAWGIQEPEHFFTSKIKSTFIVSTLVLIVLCSLFLTTQAALLQRFEPFFLKLPRGEWLWGFSNRALALIGRLIPPTLTIVAFIMAYRFLPRVKINWGDVWLGALLAGIAWELCKRGIVWYVTSIANYSQVYGSISAVLILLVWTHFSALILIWGAEFSAEYSRFRKGSIAV